MFICNVKLMHWVSNSLLFDCIPSVSLLISMYYRNHGRTWGLLLSLCCCSASFLRTCAIMDCKDYGWPSFSYTEWHMTIMHWVHFQAFYTELLCTNLMRRVHCRGICRQCASPIVSGSKHWCYVYTVIDAILRRASAQVLCWIAIQPWDPTWWGVSLIW